MTLDVLLFATLAHQIGQSKIRLDLSAFPDGSKGEDEGEGNTGDSGDARAGRAEAAGESSIAVNVGSLRRAMSHRYPQLAPLLEKTAVAVNMSYVNDEHILNAGDEVALIPPVSGG